MMVNENGIIVEAIVEKDTPGTKRYQEQEDDDHPPALKWQYIQKWAAKKMGNPNRVRITVEPLD